MKKAILRILIAAFAAASFAGCSAGQTKTSAPSFDSKSAITVVSREEGSGTRGAFIELFEVQEKDANGKNVDKTTTEANISNSTSVAMTTVSGDSYAIGYISLGSLNDTVKAVKIDGVDPTVDNIKSGAYKISRPLHRHFVESQRHREGFHRLHSEPAGPGRH
jgi:phosphate transport system substrate-binding protein